MKPKLGPPMTLDEAGCPRLIELGLKAAKAGRQAWQDKD
jgi:hypothetical protein